MASENKDKSELENEVKNLRLELNELKSKLAYFLTSDNTLTFREECPDECCYYCWIRGADNPVYKLGLCYNCCPDAISGFPR